MMSTCPRCRTALRPATYEGANVETCPDCRGEWLGPDDLKHIVDTRELTWDPEALRTVQEAPPFRRTAGPDGERLACPACGEAMESFNYAGDSGIFLDKCRQCGGIWLDGGELEQVQLVVEAADAASEADAR